MNCSTGDSFVGRRIDGYLQLKCILTAKAAAALKGVQDELTPVGLGLKIFGACRPQRAVDDFVHWAEDLNDVRMKDAFYPQVKNKEPLQRKVHRHKIQPQSRQYCGSDHGSANRCNS